MDLEEPTLDHGSNHSNQIEGNGDDDDDWRSGLAGFQTWLRDVFANGEGGDDNVDVLDATIIPDENYGSSSFPNGDDTQVKVDNTLPPVPSSSSSFPASPPSIVKKSTTSKKTVKFSKKGNNNNKDDSNKDHFINDGDVREFRVPEKDPNPNDVDKMMAQGLEQMHVDERELIYEEVHGVDQIVDESADFVASKLAEMDEHLYQLANLQSTQSTTETAAAAASTSRSGSTSTCAYIQAMSMDPYYVQSLRVTFLRIYHFQDPKSSAKRMIDFFQAKRELFGERCLVRDLKLSDLSKDDLSCLRSGIVQVLPVRDRSGRPVWCLMINIQKRPFKEAYNLLKAWIYMLLTLAEDEDTQKRGVVCLVYFFNYNKAEVMDRGAFYKLPSCLNWLPLRHVSFHFCFQNPVFRTFLAMALYSFPKETRSRVRVHDGASPTECKYALMTYGLPVGTIPITAGMKLKTDNHKKWLARRSAKDYFFTRRRHQQQQQQQNSGGTIHYLPPIKFEGIDFPGPNCVLLGRGKPFRDHTGNVRMRNLVEVHHKTYHQLSTQHGQKTKLAEYIIQLIETSKPAPGRFLKLHPDPDHGWWIEASRAEAIDKVTQAFRTARYMNNPTTTAGTTSSSSSTTGTKEEATTPANDSSTTPVSPSLSSSSIVGSTTTTTTTTATTIAAIRLDDNRKRAKRMVSPTNVYLSDSESEGGGGICNVGCFGGNGAGSLNVANYNNTYRTTTSDYYQGGTTTTTTTTTTSINGQNISSSSPGNPNFFMAL